VAHDVFISYSQHDKTVADAVCASLEAEGMRCWIAPRDPTPGGDWGGEIIQAIDAAKVFVLVFSGQCNGSVHVRNELLRAVNQEIPIIPFRVEDEKPTGALALHLEGVHWLDALTPPLEDHLKRLSEFVRKVLSEGLPEITKVVPKPRFPLSVKYLLLLALVAVSVVAAFVFLWVTGGPDTPPYVPEMSLKEMFKSAERKQGDFLRGPEKRIRMSPREPLKSPPDVNQSVLYNVKRFKQPLKLTFGQIPPGYPFCIEMVVDGTRVYPDVTSEYFKQNKDMLSKYITKDRPWATKDTPLDQFNLADGDDDRLVCQAGFHDFDGDGFPEVVA
jgi:hypothetical protein